MNSRVSIVFLGLATLALPACRDGVPRQAGPTPAPSAPPAAADSIDPAEPGIPDLARLARYVFGTMQRHEETCPVVNPFRDTLHFAFAIDVARGRMTRVAVARVGLESAEGRQRTLAQAQWPDALVVYVTCLAPHLQAVVMDPAPADGAYEPLYSFGGQPTGKPAP